MEGQMTTPDLEMVKAAMMEELGIGRKDTLPLEDRGHGDIGKAQKLPGPRIRGSDNPWQNVVFEDVDEADLQLDSIADGQLYRSRRTGAALLSHSESSRGGRRGGSKSFSQVTGRGSHQARGSGGSNRGGHSSSPGKHASTKSGPGAPSIPKGPKAWVRGGQLYDARNHVEKSAMVDAAIARLRNGPRSARAPAKSSAKFALVSTDEFYARTSIRPSSGTPASITAQHASQVSHTNRPVTSAKDPPVTLNEKHSVVVNKPLVNTKTGAANAIIGDKHQPTPSSVGDKKQPIPTRIEDRKHLTPTLIGDSQQPTLATVNHGQAGLAGSRWADPPVAGTLETKSSDTPLVKSSGLPVTKPYVTPVTKSSDYAVTKPSIPPVAKFLSQAATDVPSTPSARSTNAFPVTDTAGQVTLRQLDQVKISNNLMPENTGTIRFCTNLGSDSANLQIIINNASVLDEPLYASDTFEDKGDDIIFQAYSAKGDGPIWKLTCPLPYQSAMIVAMIKKRVSSMPRPIERQPIPVATSAPPAKKEPIVEASANEQASLKSVVIPAANPDPTHCEECELLIDFDSVEEPKPILSSSHVLMGLMTDERSMTYFLEGLNQSPEGEFLDRVFAVAGYPPDVGYSAQMLSAARTLVLDFYIQSDIFHKLPTDISEPLVYETSVKVLEMALSAWRAQCVEFLQTAQPDEDQSAKPGRNSVVYQCAALLSLRSRAATLEGKLISDHDYRGTEAKAKGSSKGSSVSGKSQEGGSGRILPFRRPTRAPSDIKPSEPSTSVPTSAINSLAASGDKETTIGRTVPSITTPMADVKPTDAQYHTSVTNPFTPNRVTDVKSAEPLLSPDLDLKSESSDTELSSKLRALSLANTPAGSGFIPSPIATSNDGRVGASVKKENINPTGLRTEEGNANQSGGQPSSGTRRPASILEISNGDLKGNPGLAASRWAQPAPKYSAPPELRRANSGRTSHSPQRPNISLAHSPQPDVRASNQRSATSTHHFDASGLHQHPYPFVPTTFMPQQPLIAPQVPQLPMPQITTVLVTDPVTGEVREVTGITKFTQPVMLYPSGYPAHHGSPIQPVPAGFPVPQANSSAQVGNKPHEPSPLRAGAGSFSPGGGARPPLSPTRRENAQVQAKKYSDASPFS